MDFPNYGRTTRVVVTGLTCVASNNVQLIGVMLACTGTSIMAIYHGVTASASVAVVRGYASVAVGGQPGLYFPVPAYCSGGMTVDLDSCLDPNITLFWNPVGRN